MADDGYLITVQISLPIMQVYIILAGYRPDAMHAEHHKVWEMPKPCEPHRFNHSMG